MRINTGRGYVDLGPGSGRVMGARRSDFLAVALEEPRTPTAKSYTGRCVVCGEKTLPGRLACGPVHQKVAYGDRR